MIRHFVTSSNQQGFEATLKEIEYHQRKLDMIRNTSSDRFHMLVLIYAYLHHANHRQYYSEAVAKIQLAHQIQGVRNQVYESDTKKAPAAGSTPPAAPSSTAKCTWCHSTKHGGGKASCPFAKRSIGHQASITLAARAEQRTGAFAGTAAMVIKEHFAEKEKEKEREKEKENQKLEKNSDAA